MGRLAKLRKLGKQPPKRTGYKTAENKNKKKKKPSPASSKYTGVKTTSKTKVIAEADTGKKGKTESWRKPKTKISPKDIPEGMVYFEPTGSYVHEQNLKEAVLQYMSIRKYHTDFERLPKGKKEAIMKLYEKSAYKEAMERDIADKVVTAQEWTARRGISGSTITLYSAYSAAPTKDVQKAQAKTILEKHLQAMGISGAKKQAISGKQATLKGKNMLKEAATLKAYKEPTLTQAFESFGEEVYKRTRNTNLVLEAAGEVVYGTLSYPSYAERQFKAMGRRFSEVLESGKGFGTPQFAYIIGEEGGEFLTQTSLMTVGGLAGPGALTLSMATYEAIKKPEAVKKEPLKFAARYALVYGVGKAGEVAGAKVSEKLEVAKGKLEAKVSKSLKYSYTIGELDIGYGKITGKGKSILKGKLGPLKLEAERPYTVEYATPVKYVGKRTTLQTTGMLDVGKGKVYVEALGKKIKIAETEPTKALLDITKKGKSKTITTLATELKTGKRVGTISQAVSKARKVPVFESKQLGEGEFHVSYIGREGYIGSVSIGEGRELGLSMVRFREYQKLKPKVISTKEKTGIELLWEGKLKEPLETMKAGKVKAPKPKEPSIIQKFKIEKRKLSDFFKKKGEYYEYRAKVGGKHLIQEMKQKVKGKISDVQKVDVKGIEKLFTGESVMAKLKTDVKIGIKTSTSLKTIAVALGKQGVKLKETQKTKAKKPSFITLPKVSLELVGRGKQKQGTLTRLLAGYPSLPTSRQTTQTLTRTPLITIPAPPSLYGGPEREPNIKLPGLPTLIPPLDLSFKGIKPEKRGSLKVKARYKPSLDAVLFGITGKKPTKLTGLETRPILKGMRRRVKVKI